MIHEIPYCDPLQLFAPFAGQSGAILLDSAELRTAVGRYSFIAVDPFLTLESKNGVIKLGEAVFLGDPFLVLAHELSKFSQEKIADLPPFQGGVAGFFGYELGHHLEKLQKVERDDMQFPDLALGFYDCVIGFDEVEKRAWIFSTGWPEQDSLKREQRAKMRLKKLLDQIDQVPALSPRIPCALPENSIQSNFSRERYQDAVTAVIHSILAGDIFEANISQRFQVPLPADFSAFNLYRALRALNAAPFAAYVNLANTILVSASPERFLSLHDKTIVTRPIKGTRPRGSTPADDEQFARELLASEKDHAENVMIVDLLRNDLSRICLDHSVRVLQLCALERHTTVHHLVSVITGTLQDKLTAVDVLRATFPGGSITGAPKICSMETITEIERHARGPYCGSIGYIGFDGDMDTSITIRTIAIKNQQAVFQAGGAVTADSDPNAEYEETLAKAAALRRALVETT